MSTDLDPAAPENTSIALIRDALANKVDPATLRELLAVRREWEADEARKAFNVAISEFQRRAPIVAKLDVAHEKSYARRDRIWRDIRIILTDLGLSVTFQISELRTDGLCHVEGLLRHRAGHGERIVQDIPLPELIRGQNKSQQMGSATEYARRYATCSALGVVTGDDDDANKTEDTLNRDEIIEISDMLDACRGLNDFNEPAFWKWVGVKNVEDIKLARLVDVRTKLKKKLKGDAS